MRISKTSLWLSEIDALLVLIASVAGIFLKSIYARETPSGAVQAIGQDIVNLVAVVVLFIAAYFVSKGSVKAFLIWSGVLLYLLYGYSIYAFDIHFNSLFLIYVAILGLSFYALVGSVIHMHLDDFQSSFSATTLARLVSVFFLLGDPWGKKRAVFHICGIGGELKKSSLHSGYRSSRVCSVFQFSTSTEVSKHLYLSERRPE